MNKNKISTLIANVLSANNIAVPIIDDRQNHCPFDDCACECDYNCDWSFSEDLTSQ